MIARSTVVAVGLQPILVVALLIVSVLLLMIHVFDHGECIECGDVLRSIALSRGVSPGMIAVWAWA